MHIVCGDLCYVANRTDFSSCSIPATVGKQQKRTRRNHGCSSSWTTTWILGVALASFLLTVALNVSSSFRRAAKARSAQTAGRVCATFKARTKKKTKKNRKHLHSDKAQRHSLERRTEHYSRQSCAEQPKTTHHLYNEQPRHQSKQANRT